MKYFIQKPLHVRLLTTVFLVLVFGLLLVGTIGHLILQRFFQTQARHHLSYTTLLIKHMVTSQLTIKPLPPDSLLISQLDFPHPIKIILRQPDGTRLLHAAYPNPGFWITRTLILPQVNRDTVMTLRDRQGNPYLIDHRVIKLSTQTYYLETIVPLHYLQRTLWQLDALLAAGGLGLILFTLSLIHFLTARFIRELETIVSSAQAIAQGESQTISTHPHAPELKALVNAITTLANNLQRTAHQLKQEWTELNSVLRAITEGIIAFNSRGLIRFFNEPAVKLLGTDGLLQRNIHYSEAIRNRELLALLDKFFQAPYTIQQEVLLNNSSIVEVIITPIGKVAGQGCVVTLRDISAQRKVEQIRKDFVANVSHEFKTPLTAIRGYAETLLDWGLEDPDTTQNYLRKIVKTTGQLEALVMDLLELARIEQLQNIEREPVILPEVVNNLVADFRLRWQEKSLQINQEFPPTLPPVLGKADLVYSMLANIIDNAIKYTPAGGKIHIRASIHPHTVQLAICDTGMGIPQNEIDRIFERFYRVDKSRSRQMGSTGLGLAIVKHIAELLDVAIHVESQEGKGSCFYLTFPAIRQV